MVNKAMKERGKGGELLRFISSWFKAFWSDQLLCSESVQSVFFRSALVATVSHCVQRVPTRGVDALHSG